ncbi:hypothetical protein ScPMuIL_016897 [Solemya velum]
MARRLALTRSALTSILALAFVCVLVFALFNYRGRCVITMPETLVKSPGVTGVDSSRCQVEWHKLGVRQIDITEVPNFNVTLEKNPEVKVGGHWKPQGCVSWQKVAIVIPYRDRDQHLKILLSHLHPMLNRQKIEYRIFVIEQWGDDKFNRGKLMNAGFIESEKYGPFDCFIFHDVDLVPENDRNLYLCDNHLRHLSSAIDEMRYHVMYYNYAGGVIAIKKDRFIEVNGFANSYWGWGNEDDDFSARTQEKNLLLTRPPEYIGRFKMVRHKKESRNAHGNDLFFGWRGRWETDGLNSHKTMNYSILTEEEMPLYTQISVDLGPSKNHMINPDDDTTKESLWTILSFYFP